MDENCDRRGFAPIAPAKAIQDAQQVGPGPYIAIPIADFVIGERPTHHAAALWVPLLSDHKDEKLRGDELAGLLRRWREFDSCQLMVRPLYVGPEGRDAEYATERVHMNRLPDQNRTGLRTAAEGVIRLLEADQSVAGRSFRAARTHNPALSVGLW